ncbi:hypothetical protein HPP92_022707 [Vanilla planifolia]|uniref:Inactive shikimate kinase like 1, chloroplastic n=1 Tax=Vanilla planifolia TaxID=51239 RepID=A0A835UE30_VANPL|nr:hypothetical protein HPP92_022707 [Vanilla planifolia]
MEIRGATPVSFLHALHSRTLFPLKARRSLNDLSPSSLRGSNCWSNLGSCLARKHCRYRGSCGSIMSAMVLEASFVVKKKAVDVCNELKGTSIFLVGVNCTTKTNTGKLLANALRYCYLDSDSIVEQATGCSSDSKSFREREDEAFREAETEVLKQLSSTGHLVVSVSDGAVESARNLAFMRDGISLWIDVPLDMIANEIHKAKASLLNLETNLEVHSFEENQLTQVMEDLSRRYEELRAGYATADATVSLLKVATQLGYEDFDSVSLDNMAMQALKEIERLIRLKKMMEAAAQPF